MTRTAKKVSYFDRMNATKIKRQTIEVDEEIMKKVKELLPVYNIKSFQALFEYLIVSGAVYLKRDIIQLIRDRTVEVRKKYTEMNLKKFKKEHTKETPKIKLNPSMYERDYEAFAKFVIEENTKKYWVIEILLEEFSKENPIIIDHIKQCQSLNVLERRKQVDRVADQQYVYLLDHVEASKILDRNTKKYDKKEFKEHLLQNEVQNFLSENRAEKETKQEVSDALSVKMRKIAFARTKEIEQSMESPNIFDDDTEDEDEFLDDEE